MEREYAISERKGTINNEMKQQLPISTFKIDEFIESQPLVHDSIEGIVIDTKDINNGAYRSITNILKILVPIWIKSIPPVITSGDTLFLKLGGDGRNVGKNQNHVMRSEEHTSELQSQSNLVCRLLLEKKKKKIYILHKFMQI